MDEVIGLDFEAWMTAKGVGSVSAGKYAAAISRSISDFAISKGLIRRPLNTVTSYAEFDEVRELILLDRDFVERDQRGNRMYSSALNHFGDYLADNGDGDLVYDLGLLEASSILTETEKRSHVNARIGQGEFRKQLISYWGRCAVTGHGDERLLVASHIKPWRVCNNAERLDKFNGLLLSPTLDKAFDTGLITFESSGEIRVSPAFRDAHILGISHTFRIELEPRHGPYMNYHRANVYVRT